MKIPKDYHSALKNENEINKKLDFYSKGKSTVLSHDVNNIDGIPEIFNKADIIYSEPAWNNGYELFKKRANIKNPIGFKNYLKSIEKTIRILNKPSFIIGGKHMIKIISPDYSLPIKFNGFDAYLFIWNYEKVNFKNNIDLLEYLSKNYNTVLDFCCGYGHYFEKFKNFIASDLNKKCVYFVAKKYLNYEDTIS